MSENFVQVPWSIESSNLDPYQFRLWVHIARVGVCWQSIRTMAEACSMSVAKTHDVKNWLLENGYLKYAVDQKTGRGGVIICVDLESDEASTNHSTAVWSYSDHVRAKLAGINGAHCVYCGSDQIQTLDHWIPRALGGPDERNNLVPACAICNKAKNDLTGNEFITILLQRGWMLDDRSPDEQTQQIVRHTNRSVRHTNGRSPHEQERSPHERHLKKNTEVENMKKRTEEESEARANGFWAIPEGLDATDFVRAWGRWLSYVDERGLDFTETQAKLTLDELARHGAAAATGSVINSIRKGWRNVYMSEPISAARASPGANGHRSAVYQPNELGEY